MATLNRRAFMAQAAIAAPIVALPIIDHTPVPSGISDLAQERAGIMREYGVPDLDDDAIDALGSRLSSVEGRISVLRCNSMTDIAEKLRIVLSMEAFCDKSAERIVESALVDMEFLQRTLGYGYRP